ncbi:DUF221-domain-containing protein [Athelia psychrophila]|uniref:DUF221-domain-containing protein n=1 Tax=Athelia psychrophila TaxID=1759441 RepID=A0A166NIZ1_9AGAM|nr:DUF221-domain-containing protein [Fibularhizoctonia sp. CBS 109695]
MHLKHGQYADPGLEPAVYNDFMVTDKSDSDTQAAAKSSSTSTFVTALWLNAAVFAAELVIFTILRPRFKSVYEARTITPIASKRVAPMPSGLLSWPLAVWRADYEDIVRVNGMDAYFFVRFLRMIALIFLPIWALSWAVLMPVDAVNTSVAGKAGLDIFILGNIATDKQARYAAHCGLCWVFTFWIFWNIRREMAHFITKRQRFLISPEHARSVQATTVLITGIPAKYLTHDALHSMYSHLPGGVKKIWLNRDLKELPEAYDRRLKACNKLESAENALLKMAAKIRRKQLKKSGAAASPSTPPNNNSDGAVDPLTRPSHDHQELQDTDPEAQIGLAERLVPAGKRPSHRLPAGFMPFALPLIGQKVDSITWAREQLEETNALLAKGRAELDAQGTGPHFAPPALEPGKKEEVSDKDAEKEVQAAHSYPPLNSAFVTFNTQIAAHMAKDTLNHHEPYRMTGRYADVAPQDVIWSNLGMNAYEAKLRMLVSYAATFALIVFWAIPVAFIGVISNVQALCKKESWLAWLCKIPPVVLGLIQGVLPTVLLAVLMMLLPIILRALAKFEGIPKRTGLELSLMTRYFMFLVVHSFLIMSLSSGIIATLPQIIADPSSVPTLLAKNLPQASTFFLTYILLQGLTGTAGGFLMAVTLLLHYIKLTLLGSTPRSIYGLKYGASSVAWGTLFPGTTLLVVIGLGYSIIAPVINGLVCVCFLFFYMLYKYLFLWVLEQPASADTGGLFFPKAINHIFVGLYVQQVLLAALFFLAAKGKPTPIPEGALMVVLILVTAIFQGMINNSYGPLLHSLPLSLVDRIEARPLEVPAEQRGAGGKGGVEMEREQRGVQPAWERAQQEEYSTGASASQAPMDAKIAAEKAHYGKNANAAGTGDGRPYPFQGNDREEHQQQQAHAYPPSSPQDSNGDEDEQDMKQPEEHDYGFAHPAASRPQRTVWIARDSLGLGAEEARANRERGIDVSLADAEMDGTGKVVIAGPPPDEESRA